MKFLTKEHENRIVNLLQRDRTHPEDMERLALFYIIAGNADLHTKVSSIYNFVEHQTDLIVYTIAVWIFAAVRGH